MSQQPRLRGAIHEDSRYGNSPKPLEFLLGTTGSRTVVAGPTGISDVADWLEGRGSKGYGESSCKCIAPFLYAKALTMFGLSCWSACPSCFFLYVDSPGFVP